jgi:hypothetical protein
MKLTLRRLSLLAVLPVLVLLGCGDDNETPAQARVDGGLDASAFPTCDPVRQNCPAGQQCTGGCNVAGVMALVFTCAVPNPGATNTNGQDCGLGCAPGHDCFTVPAAGGGTRNVCRKYCNSNADCPNNNCTNEGLVCSASQSPIGRVCAP